MNTILRMKLAYYRWALRELWGNDPLHQDIPELAAKVQHLEEISRPLDLREWFAWSVMGLLVGLLSVSVWGMVEPMFQRPHSDCPAAPAPRAANSVHLWGDTEYGAMNEQSHQGSYHGTHSAERRQAALGIAGPR